MTLKLQIESLDGLEDSEKEHYVKDSSGDGFSIIGLESHVSGLKSTLSKFKLKNETLTTENDTLKPFSNLIDLEGFDPSKVQELIAKAANAKDPKAIEESQRLHEASLAKKDETILGLQNEIKTVKAAGSNYIKRDMLTKEAIASGVDKDFLEYVVDKSFPRFDLSDDKDEKGNKRLRLKDSEGFAVGNTPSEFFTGAYKSDHSQFYAPDKIEGSNSRRTTAQSKSDDTLSATQKIAKGLSEKK